MERQDIHNQHFSFWVGLLTAFLCVIFGSNAVAVKFSFSGIGIFTTAAIRFSIAAVVIYLWARLTGQSLALKKGQIHQVLILGAIFATQLSLFYFGLSKSNASRGALLANMVPFHILFLAHFFIPGDRITRAKFFGVLLGFSGVAFMFSERSGITADFRIGDTILLVATFIWACNAVYLKRIIHGFSPFHVTLYSMIFAVPVFFVESHLNIKIVGALFYQSIVTASFGFVIWNTLLQKYGAVALHSFIFIMPIAGVALGGLILGEPITPKLLIALVLIVAGILIVHWRPKKEAPAYPNRKSI